MQELVAGNSPRTIHFFLDTTAMCLFFTAFIVVFFHLYVLLIWISDVQYWQKYIFKAEKIKWVEYVQVNLFLDFGIIAECWCLYHLK